MPTSAYRTELRQFDGCGGRPASDKPKRSWMGSTATDKFTWQNWSSRLVLKHVQTRRMYLWHRYPSETNHLNRFWVFLGTKFIWTLGKTSISWCRIQAPCPSRTRHRTGTVRTWAEGWVKTFVAISSQLSDILMNSVLKNWEWHCNKGRDM